jgi:ParB-like chromosome segregation protein Spo0J
MTMYPSASADKFMLRLPDGMRDTLKAAAKANGRSLNAEIVLRLGGEPPARETPPVKVVHHPLRDQFAMEMLRGLADDCGLSADEMADRCYEVADAMLARRVKEGQ